MKNNSVSTYPNFSTARPHFGLLVYLLLAAVVTGLFASSARAQSTRPMVAIHDSELTRALESAPASGQTPTGPGTTGFQWWPTDWNYFVLPEALQEMFRSDGTASFVVHDSDVSAGLLQPDGSPKYPILISLASEAIRNDEIAPLTNYVAAGGFLVVGSSAFTRNPDGTARGDFAFGTQMGVHSSTSALTNWFPNNTFSRLTNQRIVNHIPAGQLNWRMPSSAEEIPWGTSPDHPFLAPHDIWRVQATDATVLANADNSPYVTIKPYGKGFFIYLAGFQPLIGHNGFAPGMYSYAIFRRAIEWAFESANLPLPRLSPWPFQYDAAFMLRHDLENFQNEIAGIEASAQFEFNHGAKGDYFFCTGTLREEMSPGYDTNAVINSIRNAVVNYGATVGPHNGGLRNPNNPSLTIHDYDYWHWGPDEALDTTPLGYSSGKAYALASLSTSFNDIESWMTGITNGLRSWVACYFNATREDSCDIQAQAGVNIAGDQKLSPFPHWTVSSATSGKVYPFVSLPTSDWFVGGLVAQSLEPWHPPGVQTSQTMHDAVDFYYGMGALINFYSHTLSTGVGDAGQLVPDYITYSLDPGLHPRVWSQNAAGLYQWWSQRSNARISASCSTNGNHVTTTFQISGASNPDTSVEVLVPGSGTPQNVQVLINGVLAGAGSYRVNSQIIKVRVGSAISQVQISYVLAPRALPDSYATISGISLVVASPGVLANDSTSLPGAHLTATLTTPPAHGTVSLNPNGGFSYTPASGFFGSDTFTYTASDGTSISAPAMVVIAVSPYGSYFSDDFTRATDPGPLAPWTAQSGAWTITGGVLEGGPDPFQTYGYAYTQGWTNYSIEGNIQFPAGAFGGALGGRLDAPSGAHYAAWVYPENSAGGSSVLKLVKFQTWTTFGYNGVAYAPIQQANLPGVGTDWHRLKLAFYNNHITVSYDGVQMISADDLETNPYLVGGITADMWTDLSTYSMLVDNVVVFPLAADDRYDFTSSTLSVSAPGVLGNDTEIYGSNLSASLVSGPAHGTLSLASDGSFTYNPSSGFFGVDSFTYQTMDAGVSLGTATVSLNMTGVSPRPTPPTITILNNGMPQIIECSAAASPASLSAIVMDGDGNALQVIWAVNGISTQTNQIPATGISSSNIVSFSANLPLGTNIIIVSASDGVFPAVTMTNICVVRDTLAPVPTVSVLPPLSGQCSVTVASRPTALDACSGLLTATTTDPLIYSGQGSFTIHWLFSDGHGNTSSQTQTVQIIDTLAPVPDVASLATLSNTVPITVPVPTATDNCVGKVNGTTTDPLTYTSGTNLVHWTYNDGRGNISTQLQTVIIWKDTVPPVLTCPASATVTNGLQVVCSFSQNGWNLPPSSSIPGTILLNFFNLVYGKGYVEVGTSGAGGFSLRFNSGAAIQTYLPGSGAPGPLTSDLVNPATSPSGVFGAQVLALQLNVDFGDAGAAVGFLGSLGNLVLNDPSSPLNGMSVRQILALANIALGGGNVSGYGMNIAGLSALVDNINRSFEGCVPGAWAIAHLLPASAAVSSTGTATAVDNVDPKPVVSYSDVISPGTCLGSFTIARTWKAVDASSNASTCIQTISLLGKTAGVCGYVARDCDANGLLLGENGLAGITVSLKNTAGSVLATTTTDASGAYCFSALSAGNYIVAVTPPAGYVQTVDPDGLKDNQTVVSLPACQTKYLVNFGYTGTAPSVSITQSGPSTAKAGDTVTFIFAVTNSGNTCFTGGMEIQDALLGGSIFFQYPVSPGQGFTFTKTYVVKSTDPANLVSTAVAIGHQPLGAAVSSSASWVVAVVSTPINLVATPGNGTVTLTWNAVANPVSYNVKRATSSAGPFSLIKSGLVSPGYLDSGLVNGTTYFYIVTAVRGGVESSASPIAIAIPTAGLPSPWNTKDIGGVSTGGGVTFAPYLFTVNGSGADIWDVADEFRYVFQLASGDCSIVARVTAMQDTDPWAKAGVMIRETLAAGSSHASAFVTAENGVAFQYRSGTGSTSGNSNTTGLTAPYWVRVTRAGNVFSSYRSSNGTTWTLIGSQTISMGTSVYIGLAVTSHNDGTLCKAVFDNVTATP